MYLRVVVNSNKKAGSNPDNTSLKNAMIIRAECNVKLGHGVPYLLRLDSNYSKLMHKPVMHTYRESLIQLRL